MPTFDSIFKTGKVLIPYITFGDPSMADTESLILTCFDSGADIVELGLPFSDPVADGPVIQTSHFRVLSKQPNISVSDAFSCVSSVRKKTDKPIILMTTVNLIINQGIADFFRGAAKAGVNGVVIPDLSIEDAEEYRRESKVHSLPIIFLVSPTCSDERLKRIVMATGGFLYLISSTGTTGERTTFSNKLEKMVGKIKQIRDIPIAIGFGISQPAHAKMFWKFADAVIVGSHLVQIFNNNSSDSKKIKTELAKAIHSFSSVK